MRHAPGGPGRFLGATLWTDFALQGTDRRSIDHAMADAHDGMNDFRLIRYGESRMFRPADARAIHMAQVRWLRAKLAEEFVGPSGKVPTSIRSWCPAGIQWHRVFLGSS
jgi:hypothetical protein